MRFKIVIYNESKFNGKICLGLSWYEEKANDNGIKIVGHYFEEQDFEGKISKKLQQLTKEEMKYYETVVEERIRNLLINPNCPDYIHNKEIPLDKDEREKLYLPNFLPDYLKTNIVELSFTGENIKNQILGQNYEIDITNRIKSII
jgi:hypothetical protein